MITRRDWDHSIWTSYLRALVQRSNFGPSFRPPLHSVKTTGVLKNYNTIEEFKAADKTSLFNEVSDEV